MTSIPKLSLALSLVALTGCAATPPRSQFPTADAALDRMRATNACVNGVQGEAKLDVFSSRGRVRGQVFILALNPDRVRFDVVAFGSPVYTLTSDGTKFQMLDKGEKLFLNGPASACNLARLTQVPLPGHALVSLLRGEAPVLVHKPEGARISWVGSGNGFYRILLDSTREATQEIHLEVHPKDFEKPWEQQRVRVTGVRVHQRDIDLYDAELANFEPMKTSAPRVDPDGLDPDLPPSGPACDAELPMSIHMRVPHTGDDVVFQYKEAKWNPPVEPRSFQQTMPGGVRERYVTCDR